MVFAPIVLLLKFNEFHSVLFARFNAYVSHRFRILLPADGSAVFPTDAIRSQYQEMWTKLQNIIQVVGFKEQVHDIYIPPSTPEI